MTGKRELAKSYFEKGYNCAQAVLLAFHKEAGLSETAALSVSSSFGGGMGRLREVCGAVSGMFMAAGMLYGYTSPDDHAAKTAHYKRIQELAAAFRERNRSIICRELISPEAAGTTHVPELRTAEYYKKRPCSELVGDAAEILEEYIRNHS